MIKYLLQIKTNANTFRYYIWIYRILFFSDIYNKMKSKQCNNNFNDRLRRLGCQQLHKQIKSKQRVKTLTTEFNLLPNKNTIISPPPRQRIQINNQIDVLQQKLQLSQKEKNDLLQHIYLINSRFHEIKEQYQYAVKQLECSRKNAQQLTLSLEQAESELQNFRLMKKMQAISNQIAKQQSSPSALKHHKHRRGKFSTAALPSPFGSQKKIEFRNSQLATSESKIDLSKDNHNILSNPFSGYLIQQWEKSKQENKMKELQISSLQTKINTLKKEIVRQNKEIQSLKSQKPSNHELVAALQEIRRMERQYKTVIIRLRDSEKKRKELSTILKNKGQIIEDQKFYGFSTIADINQIIEKTYSQLQIQRSIFQVIIDGKEKGQQAVQTIAASEGQKMSSLELLINQLTNKLAGKQNETNDLINEIKKQYQSQIMEYESQIQQYKIRIEQLNVELCKYEENQGQITKNNISCQCDLLDSIKVQDESVIYQKITELLEVNEELNQQLIKQKRQKQSLNERYLLLSNPKRKQALGIQTENILVINSKLSDCQNCINLIDEIQRLRKTISFLTEERDHYKLSYQDHSNGNQQLQIEAQQQISRLRAQYQQKENHFRAIIGDFEEKYHQLQRYQQQLAENQFKLNQQTILRESLEQKLRNIEDRY